MPMIEGKPPVTHWYHSKMVSDLPGTRCGLCLDPIDLATDTYSNVEAWATCVLPAPRRSHSEAKEEPLDPAAAIGAWWHAKAQDEVSRTVPKAVEYGAYDLQLIGAVLGHMLGINSDRMSDGPNDQLRLTDAVAQELGTAFYLLGKVARMMSAYQEGRLPSDDTIFDIGIYVRMLQRIREAGSWPGV